MGKILSIKQEVPSKKMNVKESKKKWCLHEYVEVDEHNRLINCRKCGKYLDPFDVMLGAAKRENNLYDSLNYYINEISKSQNRLISLNRQVMELKKDKEEMQKLF